MGTPFTSSRPTSPGLPQASLSPAAASVVRVLPSSLGDRAANLAVLYANPNDQVAAANAAVDAFNQVNAQGPTLGQSKGQGINDVGCQGSAWDRGMTPVMASARQGLPLETMAQDAGFGGNVGGFLAQRMLDHHPAALDLPAQAVPWHPQMAPHDWEIGTAVSNALGDRISQGAAARVYHEIRSPESGGGWSAGAQFVQTVREVFERPPADPIAALNARLAEMETHGAISPRATALWRANAKNNA